MSLFVKMLISASTVIVGAFGVVLGARIFGGSVLLLSASFILLQFIHFFFPSFKSWKTIENNKLFPSKASLCVLVSVILTLVLPMGANPIWNGEIPAHRNQYELYADALIDGHLDFQYDDIDSVLNEMDNPYDPEARAEMGAVVHWDHAYFQGKYYMYFGVVPAVLLFVPYKLVTGTSLTTYCATQFFTIFFIFGLYCFMRLISFMFRRRMPEWLFLMLFAAFSFISCWYIVEAPALYCTAISSGICFQVWSLFFYATAVWGETTSKRWVVFAFLGALCGALVVGCRPPIAIANIMAIPLLVQFLKTRKRISLKVVFGLLVALLPYIVIFSLIMMYNYVRFDSVTEFGQSYQMTVADQHDYPDLFSRILNSNIIVQVFVCFMGIGRRFPGIFWEYPIFLSMFCLFISGIWKRDVQLKYMRAFGVAALACILLIVISQVIASPFLLERYKLDFLWLCCIVSFIVIYAVYSILPRERTALYLDTVFILSMQAIACSVMLFMVPNDCNLTALYLEDIKAIFR